MKMFLEETHFLNFRVKKAKRAKKGRMVRLDFR